MMSACGKARQCVNLTPLVHSQRTFTYCTNGNEDIIFIAEIWDRQISKRDDKRQVVVVWHCSHSAEQLYTTYPQSAIRPLLEESSAEQEEEAEAEEEQFRQS